jgi:TPR repeat protein
LFLYISEPVCARKDAGGVRLPDPIFATAEYWLRQAAENGYDEAQEYLYEWFVLP